MLGSPPRHSASFALAVAVAWASFGCAERRPNSESSPSHLAAPSPSPSSANLAPTAPSAATPAPAPAPAPSAAAPAPSASAPSASAANAPDDAAPSLLDSDGKPLPQTEERPRVDSAAFKQRVELLARAIVRDDPSLARPAFFPVVAYEQVKAVAKPERDWQYRLMRAFEADVHEYHRALGRDPEKAQLAGIDVPEPSARWMKPGSEGNRLGYFRVLRSHLRFSKADGKQQTFEVTSMISWRGEWYVVHLNGFD